MTKKAVAGIVALVAVAVVFGIVVGGWYLGTRNRLVTLDEGINAAWSEIDNQLKRRSDLIPNLVATVKGFARQELQVFGEIAEARARLSGARSVGEAAQGYNQLESALGRLLVIVENYPELKSSENFTRLQDELAGTENRIAVARKRYNDSVREFNTRIRRYPASVVAGRLGFESREYFQIEERAREAPEVDFEKQRDGA
jgi:LemA protein